MRDYAVADGEFEDVPVLVTFGRMTLNQVIRRLDERSLAILIDVNSASWKINKQGFRRTGLPTKSPFETPREFPTDSIR